MNTLGNRPLPPLKLHVYKVGCGIAGAVDTEDDDRHNQHKEQDKTQDERLFVEQFAKRRMRILFLYHADAPDHDHAYAQQDIILPCDTELEDLRLAADKILIGEEAADRHHALLERGRYVEHVADQYDDEGTHHLEQTEEEVLAVDMQLIGHSVKDRLHQDGQHDDTAVPDTESDIFITRAVPDADDQEYDQRGERRRQHLGDMRAGFGLAEAGALHLLARVKERGADRQRVEDVILHPRAQRDMPSAPVLVDTLREVRTPEVFDHIDAEELRDAAGDIDTAREVGIQLEGVQQDREGQRRTGILIVALIGRGHGIDRDDRSVRNDQLLEEAPQDQL